MSAQIKKAGAGRAPALAGIRNRRWKGAGVGRNKKPALEGRRHASNKKPALERAPDGLKGLFPPRLAARGSLDDYFWMFA
jgi:hypothetical protein